MASASRAPAFPWRRSSSVGRWSLVSLVLSYGAERDVAGGFPIVCLGRGDGVAVGGGCGCVGRVERGVGVGGAGSGAGLLEGVQCLVEVIARAAALPGAAEALAVAELAAGALERRGRRAVQLECAFEVGLVVVLAGEQSAAASGGR